MFAYSLSSSLLLAVMYMAYKWMLASERQHAFNRVILWSIYIVALTAVPLAGAIPSLLRPESQALIPVVEIDMSEFAVIPVDVPSEPSIGHTIARILLITYLVGVIAVTAHTLMVALRLAMIVRQGESLVIGGRRVRLISSTSIAPFSVMNVIVMSRRDFAEAGPMILAHECCHVRLRHWIDLLMAQLVAIFQWYNPASWLMREEMKAVHEYQADAGVIASGADVKQYQMLLIKKAVGARFPSLANSLNHSKLKKRITMMYNSRTSRVRRLRALAIIPALGTALFVTNLPAVADVLDTASRASLVIPDSKVTQNPANEQLPADFTAPVQADTPAAAAGPDSTVEVVSVSTMPSKNLDEVTVVAYSGCAPTKPSTPKTDKTEKTREATPATASGDRVYDVVEHRPKYSGGEEALFRYIAENVRYPEDARRDSIQGRVILRFVVTPEGKVSDPTILRGVSPSIDAEAIRLVSAIPEHFVPGTLKGEPVAVNYHLPIVFKLNSSSKAPKTVPEKPSGKKPSVYINGRLAGNTDILPSIDENTIKSVDVLKPGNEEYPDGAIMITLKDTNPAE
ncbi:MAG: TonB family protein [Paenibacillus sp.]|nr:TonB family protein [Paenibacillus sp.]